MEFLNLARSLRAMSVKGVCCVRGSASMEHEPVKFLNMLRSDMY